MCIRCLVIYSSLAHLVHSPQCLLAMEENQLVFHSASSKKTELVHSKVSLKLELNHDK